MTSLPPHTAKIMAGVPAKNTALYHQIRFLVGDPAVLLITPEGDRLVRTLLVRDIELERARKTARADRIESPRRFAPPDADTGDREVETAQAAAHFLASQGIREVISDRTLPLIYHEMLVRAGLRVRCDLAFGVAERRVKDEQEIAWLREAQAVTERVMERACQLVARADARAGGMLYHEDQPLTSERLQRLIDIWLLEEGYENPGSIVAGGPQGADCHEHGSGPLYSGQPVIVDIFPCSKSSRYNGDCTRTVVHGDVPDEVAAMHRAVCEAKAAGMAVVRAGTTGEAVHEATVAVIRAHGYGTELPKADDPPDYCAMVHGTGHGIGLDVHEAPLLASGGPALLAGDAVTVEPGLYCRAIGGVRVEDLVIVTEDGYDNLNRLPEGLDWR